MSVHFGNLRTPPQMRVNKTKLLLKSLPLTNHFHEFENEGLAGIEIVGSA